MEIEVPITKKENEDIEEAFYTYQVSINVLKSFLSENIKNDNYLTSYFTSSQSYGKKLEELKEILSKKYVPIQLQNILYTYTFNFDNCSIIYKTS